MPIKASELVDMLNEHIQKYGDGHVMIYDDYSVVYKSIRKDEISRTHGDKFVIQCNEKL
ncbi:hypothetical protein D3C76_1858820 [compost metagenome]